MLAIAEQSGNVDLTAESFQDLAFPQMFAGDFELPAESFDRSVSLFQTTTGLTGTLAWRTYKHAEPYALSAWNAWFLGFPDRALNRVDQALALARASDSKALEEAVRGFSIEVFSLRRDLERTTESAGATMALATEPGDQFRRALGEFYLGWSDFVARGRPEGIARMRQADADVRATGFLISRLSWQSRIAQVQYLLGQYDNASVAIDEALAAIQQTGARAYAAEVHRTRGELLCAKGVSNAMQAEQSFRTAIEIARHQKARSWELRATTSLARLLRDTGRRDEAREALAPIYSWFTEGFDTFDLKDAKALLEELGGSQRQLADRFREPG